MAAVAFSGTLLIRSIRVLMKIEEADGFHVLTNKFYLSFLRKVRHMLVEKMLQQNKILVRTFLNVLLPVSFLF